MIVSVSSERGECRIPAFFLQFYAIGILVNKYLEKEIGNLWEKKENTQKLSFVFSFPLSFHSLLLYYCLLFRDKGTKSLSCKYEWGIVVKMSGEYFNFFDMQDVQIKKTHLRGALKTPYTDYKTGVSGAVLWPLSA